MVLGGGSAGGVSPTGLSILMESSVGDFDASLGSLLCRSLAVVWGSGVLPEDDQPCLGTEKANDNIPDISCLKQLCNLLPVIRKFQNYIFQNKSGNIQFEDMSI